jgi:hypothetical protein
MGFGRAGSSWALGHELALREDGGRIRDLDGG